MPATHVVRQHTSFHYRAKNWSKAHRVVAKVEFQPGELFPWVGFIVTNRSLPNERVLAASALVAQHYQATRFGKGRFLDNIFVERLWRSLKYECVYPWRGRGKETSRCPDSLAVSTVEKDASALPAHL